MEERFGVALAFPRDVSSRSEVNDGVNIPHRCFKCGCLGEVCCEARSYASHQISTRVASEPMNGQPGGNKRRANLAPHEPGRARDENRSNAVRGGAQRRDAIRSEYCAATNSFE